MSFIRNQLDSHIILNVERIDFNEKFQNGNGDPVIFENQLHGIIAEAFEHLKGLSHINICRYTNMLRLDGNAYLLVSEGYSFTLNKVLSCSKEEFGKLNIARIVNQAISGLQYLHTSGFSHGKLTLDCLSVSDEGLVKISGYANNYFNTVLNYLVDKLSKSKGDKEELDTRYKDNESKSKDNKGKEDKRSKEHTENKNKEEFKNYIMSPFDWLENGNFVEFAKESVYLFNLLPYMPPELIFLNRELTKDHMFWFNVDIWSLGICILILVSYTISASGISTEFRTLESQDNICKIGENGVYSTYLNVKGCKNCNYFEKLRKTFNSDCPNEQFVESFVFVSYLLLLISKFDLSGSLSTLGLDIPKILDEQFSCLSKDKETEHGLGVITKIFQRVNLNNKNNKSKSNINNKDKDNTTNNNTNLNNRNNNLNNNDNNYNKNNKRLNGEYDDKQEDRSKTYLQLEKEELEEFSWYEEALRFSIDFLTGGHILRNLIEYEEKVKEDREDKRSKEDTQNNDNENERSKLEYNDIKDNIFYLLSLANDCLVISNSNRPSIIDINAKQSFLKLSLESMKINEETHCWFIYRYKDNESKSKDNKGKEDTEKSKESKEDEDRESRTDGDREDKEDQEGKEKDTKPGKERGKEHEQTFCESYSLDHIKESDVNLSESKFFLNYVDLEHVLYYWTLLGNEPGNIIPFEFKHKIEIESDGFKQKNYKLDSKYKSQAMEYFKRYKVGKVFLGELITHVKLANLFPMIIEHQLRPSCVYARQHCFIYQLLRIRRFKRLLSNPIENKRQIFVEAMIDIPPLLRSQIWCNLLEIIYRKGKKKCPLNTGYEFKTLPPDVEQNLNFYNNDLLYSSSNVDKLLRNVESLKNKIIHQQLPSSIYSFAIPLLMLYHDSKVYSLVLEKIFCKYLKEFYAPTGSFVNNYLSEFSTILNFFDPEVSYHLRSIGAYADSYALPWFMSLFAENTSVEQLYLIWDSILVQPKQYIKFLAVMIIHNIRERLLGITDASIAISFISCVMDSLNVPMLMYLTTHMYNTWCEVLNAKVIGHKAVQNLVNDFGDEVKENKEKVKDENKNDSESINLDKNTFVFISEEYPFERCFKLSIETFSNVFSNCIIIDLRSLESYNLGHIPNSIHINKVLSGLSDTDKKSTPISLSIFNDQNGFNTNMDFNTNSSQTQTISSLNGLRTSSKKPWMHINTPESNKVVLAAGDGYDNEKEMLYIQRLVFEFKIQHVCYYRINTEEWPKVFTLSKI